MMKPPGPVGKPVHLPPNTPVVLASINPDNNPPCYPPNSHCNRFPLPLPEEISVSDVALLVFRIASTKKQNLRITIEIAVGDSTNPEYVATKELMRPVLAGENTLVGLDSEAAKALQEYFVSGNTVILAVQPKDAGVKVRVGKKV